MKTRPSKRRKREVLDGPLVQRLVLPDLAQKAGKLNNTLRWMQDEDLLRTWVSNTTIETRLRLSRPT